MKAMLIGFLVVITLFGCTEEGCGSDGDVTLIGKWGLVESCFDIGNGTRNCTDHNQEEWFEFFEDGTVRVNNENFNCISNYKVDGSILSLLSTDGEGCSEQSFFFELVDACNARISPMCIEGCPHTYVRVN